MKFIQVTTNYPDKVGCPVKLYNVRRGQLVYYANQLYKVYAVNPFFKRSIHLYRLADLKQYVATAKEIDLYHPKHFDHFIYNHEQFTLDKDRKAEIGDYIFVIDPRPDSLDHHHLHAIERVAFLESNGVITNRSNGIKHREYWVMVPGVEKGATGIDLQQPDASSSLEDESTEPEPTSLEIPIPKIGTVFLKHSSDPAIQGMVIAIKGETVYLGGNIQVTAGELADSTIWSLMPPIEEP